VKLRIAAVAAAAIGLTGCSLQPNDHTLPGQVAVGSDGYTVTVTFDQVANLVPNSAVQMDNVVIGTVAAIDVSNWQAKVRLRMLKSADVPADAVFSIGQKTLLGAQYVDVSAPSRSGAQGADRTAVVAGGSLEDGAEIPPSRTGTYPATEQVLGAVALLLNNGGLSQIQTITSQLSTALDERVPDTRSLVRRTNELLKVLDENKSDIVSALESLDQLATGLAKDRNALGTAIDRLAPGLRTLETERASLVRAVTDTGRTGAQASRVIQASRTAILANVDALRPILTSLSEVSSTLPDALKIGLTIPFPAMTTTNALRGDYANLFTTLDLRGSSLVESWLAGLVAGTPPGGAATGATVPNTSKPRAGGTAGTSVSGTPAPTDPGSNCLLALLGLC
jgi:phospholipid/cholesterol/gamma-HCH transport system substrate-binding protein